MVAEAPEEAREEAPEETEATGSTRRNEATELELGPRRMSRRPLTVRKPQSPRSEAPLAPVPPEILDQFVLPGPLTPEDLGIVVNALPTNHLMLPLPPCLRSSV